MEERRSNTWLWIVLAVVIGVLLACGAGALAGGLAGYWAGQSAAERVQPVDEWMPCPQCPLQQPEKTPAPWLPVPQAPTPQTPGQAPSGNVQLGALILSVTPGSPAEQAGLKVDDLIVAVDDQGVSQAEALVDLIVQHEPGDEVALTVQRDGEQIEITVTLGRNPKTAGDTPWLGVSYQLVPLGQQGVTN